MTTCDHSDPAYIEHNANVVQDALDLLPCQYAEAVNIRALTRATAAAQQGVEDTALLAQDANLFFCASGAYLDRWGDLFGVAREGRSDSAYRSAIMLRVLIETSSGTAEEVIRIVSLSLPDFEFVNVQQGSGYIGFTLRPVDGVMTTELREHVEAVNDSLRKWMKQGTGATAEYWIVATHADPSDDGTYLFGTGATNTGPDEGGVLAPLAGRRDFDTWR